MCIKLVLLLLQVEYFMIPNTALFPMLEDAKTYLEAVNKFLQLPTLLSA